MKYDIQSLKDKLRILNVYPNKKLGQNFLINKDVCSQIVNTVLEFQNPNLVEVGPGLGALTELLLENKVPQLKLIELDKSFAQYWQERGVEVLHQDALHVDWSQFQGFGLVSNLPYQISSSLVIDRSLDAHQIPFMVLMFQKEVAQRILAPSGTSDYGLLSVISQVFWRVRLLMEVGPKDFYPPPSIASRVLIFEKREGSLQNPHKFLNFVKSAFAQRRKLLVSNIAGFLDKESSRKILLEMGFSETVRPEELSPDDFVTLYQQL